MTTTFIAVDNGNRADGYLVANGDVYAARSGGWGRGEIPEGVYELGGPEGLNSRLGQNRSMAKKGSDWTKFKKFGIAGVGPSKGFNKKEGLWGLADPRYPDAARTGVKFHFDGPPYGSEGCIAYDDPAAQQSLIDAHKAGDTRVEVIYVKTDAEAHAMAKTLSGKEPPANTIRGYGRPEGGGRDLEPAPRARRRRPASRQRGDTSRIKKGPRMAEGETSVLLGEKMLVAAHVQARHTGGGRIAEGSNSVYVGKQQLAFGRVDDPTTDGSEVATGEPSVMVG
jgi:hypothetical protein